MATAPSHIYSPIPSHHHPLPPPFPSYHYAAAYPPPPPGFVPDPMYAPTPVFSPPPSNHSSAYMPVTVPEYYPAVPVPTYTPGPSPTHQHLQAVFASQPYEPNWPPPAPDPSPPALAASMAAVAPTWPFPSAPLAPSTAPTASSPLPLPAPGPWTPPPPTSGAPSSSTSGTPPFPPVQGVPYSPVALHDQARPLLLQDSEVDAFQRHYLARLPSSPSTRSDPIPLATSATCSSPADHQSTPTSACAAVTNQAEGPGFPTTGNRMHQDRVPAGLNDLAQQLKLAHRSLLNINRRLDEYAESQRSVASLQGKLYKLADRLATPRVSSSASAPSVFSNTSAAASYLSSPFDPCFVVPAPILPSVSATSEATRASIVPSVTAAVASKVFGEMPAQNSWHETHGTTPTCYPGHEKPIQNSCVQSVSTSAGCQNLDGLHRSYGFHSLNIQTMFLADGTEHSYYALPEKYPLQQATSVPVFDVYDDDTEGFSSNSVDVFAGTLGQQTHEEDQQKHEDQQPICCLAKLNGGENLSLAKQDKEQLIKCFSKVSACRDVPDVYERRTCQKESQGDDKLCWEKSICRTATELPISYFPWDPGASTSLYSSKAELLGNQVETHVQQLRNTCWNVLVTSEKREEWRPGEHTVGAQHRNEVFVKCNSWLSIVLQSMGYQVEGLNPLSLTTPWDPGVLVLHSGITSNHTSITKHAEWLKLQCMEFYKFAIVHTLAVKFGASRAINFKSATMRSYAFGVDWKKVNVSALFFLVVPCSTARSQATQSLFLSHSGDNRTNHSYLKLFIQSICAATARQVTEQRHLLEPSLMVVMLLNGSIFTEGQLVYMPQGTSISCSEWVRHMAIILPCWFTPFEMAKPQWNSGIALASDMYSLLEILRAGCQTMKTFTWLQSPNFSALQIQLPVRIISLIWDPGIDSLLFLHKLLHIHLIQLVDSTTSLLMLAYQPHKLQPIVQATLKLVSLPQDICFSIQTRLTAGLVWQYLKTWEIGTFFITFLPP